MYKSALRLIAFASFVAWCLSANRAHHFAEADKKVGPDDDDDGPDFHTEGFA